MSIFVKSVILSSYMILFSLIGEAYALQKADIPFARELEEASGALYGKFNGATYKKLHQGDIVTVLSFTVIKIVGIGHHEVVNHNDFKVTMQGGKWQKMDYHVSGNPSFVEGEEVVVVLKRGKFGFELSDLGISKYKVIREGGETYLVGDQVSKKRRMKLKAFEKRAQSVFGVEMSDISLDKFVYKGDMELQNKDTMQKNNGRGLASVEESLVEEGARSIFGYSPWLAVIMVILFACTVFLIRV